MHHHCRIGAGQWPRRSKQVGDAQKLTWQALRLSLISTWLVWVPTHMYTWWEKTHRVKWPWLNPDWGRSVSRRAPTGYLLAVIQQHDVVVGQVVLAEVRALLWHGEVAFLVGTSEKARSGGISSMHARTYQTFFLTWRKIHSPEEASVFHVVCVLVVLLLGANTHPEEVLWLLPLINDLGDKHTR